MGGLKYADLDGNGIITSDDQDWIYNPVPAFSYGLNIALNYKNFDLSMFWQGYTIRMYTITKRHKLISGVLPMQVLTKDLVCWELGTPITPVLLYRL